MSAAGEDADDRISNPAAGPLRENPSAKLPPRPPLSRRRKWLFRVAVMMLAPLLFFTVSGGRIAARGLRLSDGVFGRSRCQAELTRTQLAVRLAVLPRALARTPVPCLLSAKPEGTVRIFVLGGSAAQGVPDPSFSVGRVLEVVASRALSGHEVRGRQCGDDGDQFARGAGDCPRLCRRQPDLFVVYMGNNEVVGPYGPGTVFQQWSPNRKLIRANVG